MSVTGKKYDTNTGVRKVTLTTNPELHPLSNTNSASKNYYCLGLDQNGFQYQVDLQALPAGVTLDQIQQNQVWWVEKRTTLFRPYLYAGLYDPNTRQIDSTAPLPAPAISSLNGVTASGLTVSGTSTFSNATVNNNLSVVGNGTFNGNLNVAGAMNNAGVPVVNNIWSVGPSSVVTISGYNTYLIIMTGYGSRSTTGYLTYLFNQSYSASMAAPSTLITLNTYALTANADYSSSATAIFQPTGGYLTAWYAETVNQNYNVGSATAVVVGLN